MAGIAALVLALAVGAPPVEGENGLPAAQAQAVEALISAAMTRLGIPGLSAAVVSERRLRWSASFGTADLENFVPARNVTVYRLASVTKPITATAVLQLVEAGKVDLDVPIQRYVRAFPEKQWPVTVRDLLSQQSWHPFLIGFPKFRDPPRELLRCVRQQ